MSFSKLSGRNSVIPKKRSRSRTFSTAVDTIKLKTPGPGSYKTSPRSSKRKSLPNKDLYEVSDRINFLSSPKRTTSKFEKSSSSKVFQFRPLSGKKKNYKNIKSRYRTVSKLNNVTKENHNIDYNDIEQPTVIDAEIADECKVEISPQETDTNQNSGLHIHDITDNITTTEVNDSAPVHNKIDIDDKTDIDDKSFESKLSINTNDEESNDYNETHDVEMVNNGNNVVKLDGNDQQQIQTEIKVSNPSTYRGNMRTLIVSSIITVALIFVTANSKYIEETKIYHELRSMIIEYLIEIGIISHPLSLWDIYIYNIKTKSLVDRMYIAIVTSIIAQITLAIFLGIIVGIIMFFIYYSNSKKNNTPSHSETKMIDKPLMIIANKKQSARSRASVQYLPTRLDERLTKDKRLDSKRNSYRVSERLQRLSTPKGLTPNILNNNEYLD